MSNLKNIKRRIDSAENISQITKAMEMVAASKMRDAQQRTLNARPYSNKLQLILQNLSGKIHRSSHPLLTKDRTQAQPIDLVLLISSDRGLSGGLNANLFRFVDKLTEETDKKSQIKLDKNHTHYLTIGKKAKDFVSKSSYKVVGHFDSFGDNFEPSRTRPLTKMIIDLYVNNAVRNVYVCYSLFVNTMTQKPTVVQLLPITSPIENLLANNNQKHALAVTQEYLLEPSPDQILSWLLPFYVELVIYQHLLEATASEHSARMVAMKNASENASEIMGDLTLAYNRIRQQTITAQIIDLITANMALS